MMYKRLITDSLDSLDHYMHTIDLNIEQKKELLDIVEVLLINTIEICYKQMKADLK